MKKLLAFIITGCCIFNNYAQLLPDNQDSLKIKLLQTEFAIWKSDNDIVRNRLILIKASMLKQSEYFELAYKELQRIDLTDTVIKYEVSYEKSLNKFLSADFNESYNQLLFIPDSIKAHNKSFLTIWLLTLLECNLLKRCKDLMIDLCDSNKILLTKINSLPESIEYKSPAKASTLSSILPGLGQFYGGYPAKGTTSFLLFSGFGLVSVYEIIYGYYLTASIFGVYPLVRFYIGGQQLSYTLALKKNSERTDLCKQAYRNIIMKLTK